jgi:beta-lactamase regulating signal transducer with metallopeptidase domain
MFFLVEKLSQLFTGKKKKKLKNHNNTPRNKEYPLQLEKLKHHNKKKNISILLRINHPMIFLSRKSNHYMG